MGNNACSTLRIGIPVIGNIHWLGGVSYIESLIKAIGILPKHERPRLLLVVRENFLEAVELHQSILPLIDGILFIGADVRKAETLLRRPFIQCQTAEEISSNIDFFFPVVGEVLPNLCSASWIYDFQHIHLPEFFPPSDIQERNHSFRRIADLAKLAVFSSRDSESEFKRLFPESRAVTRVLHFHALPADEWYEITPAEIQKKYHLPDHFFICCNQFWIHKNHTRLFEAVLALQEAGEMIHLVCTGMTGDHRAPGYFNHLQQAINNSQLKDYIHILGVIPRIEQIQLMRRSLAVIQPSLFEGWSTVVEDARALGKTIILSDLPVHYEQAPAHAEYFNRINTDDLIRRISRLLPALKPGPDYASEQQAREQSRQLVRDSAVQFCSLAVEAQPLFGRPLRGEKH
jgi:glycosyltransferase involved in cell wall biosynthesis